MYNYLATLIRGIIFYYNSVNIIHINYTYRSVGIFFGFVHRSVIRPINWRKARRLHCGGYLHYIKSERDLPRSLVTRVGIHRFTEVNGYPTNSLKCSTSKCAYESCPSVNLFLRSTSSNLLALRLNRRFREIRYTLVDKLVDV